MSDFSLSGFSEKGAKAWDVKGRSADIGSEIIKLYDIISNFTVKKKQYTLRQRTEISTAAKAISI